MSSATEGKPRLRQLVLAAASLEPVADGLRDSLSLAEPYADPGVALFGLRNAVFALEDTFLEVISPERPGTAAGRWLERRGGDGGYMVMFEVADLGAARARAAALGIRVVWEVELEDIAEVHLHPADMRGAIVALSQPRPPGAWRWGGPDWSRRSARVSLRGARIALSDPEAAQARWSEVLGAEASDAGITFVGAERDSGPVEAHLHAPVDAGGVEVGGVRFSYTREEKR